MSINLKDVGDIVKSVGKMTPYGQGASLLEKYKWPIVLGGVCGGGIALYYLYKSGFLTKASEALDDSLGNLNDTYMKAVNNVDKASNSVGSFISEEVASNQALKEKYTNNIVDLFSDQKSSKAKGIISNFKETKDVVDKQHKTITSTASKVKKAVRKVKIW